MGAQYKNEQKRSWTLDNLIYYNKTFAEKHNLGLTLMQSASAYHYEMGDIRATNVAVIRRIMVQYDYSRYIEFIRNWTDREPR